MLDDAARARRRELEHKAYAPGGGLSDAEARELQELMRPAAPLPAERPTPVPERPVQHPLPVPERAKRDEGRSEAEEVTTPETPAVVKPRRRWLAPVAAVLALLVGFGVGWLVFAPDAAPAMTDAQRDTWLQLQASDDFDPGSITLVGSQYGVDAWTANQSDGQLDCLFLTAGDDRRPQPSCLSADRERGPYDLQASISIGEGDDEAMVWAVLAEDTTGAPIVIMQRQDAGMTWDWRDQYSEEELPIAELLDSKGFPGDMLQIIGYDGDKPIWLHQDQQTCLIVATAEQIVAQACGDGQSVGLTMPGVAYQLDITETRGPILTIIRTPSEVSIDDKTGEITE